MENPKKTQKPELIDTENRLVVVRGRWWGVEKWMKVMKRYKLLVINKYWGCDVQHGDHS